MIKASQKQFATDDCEKHVFTDMKQIALSNFMLTLKLYSITIKIDFLGNSKFLDGQKNNARVNLYCEDTV